MKIIFNKVVKVIQVRYNFHMASSKFYARNYATISDNFKQNTNQIKAIFLDLDNTLIQTRKADVKACNKVEYN